MSEFPTSTTMTKVEPGTQSWSIVLGSGDHGTLLRAFDRARREISSELIGHEGVFIGFDSLLLNAPDARDQDEIILVNAMLIASSAKAHAVHYAAHRVAQEGEAHAGLGSAFGDETVIARGVGRTLHCRPSATVGA